MKYYITILLTLSVLFPSVHAATVEDSIIGLYVAYYNRAPDIEGFNYWKTQASQNGNTTALKAISRGFKAAPQFSEEYPLTLSDKDFVKKIYLNILKREPEVDGLNFWVGKLKDGLSKSDFILEYIKAVLDYTGDDEEGKKSTEMFENKLIVSKFFMDTLKADSNGASGTPAYTRSIKALSTITEDSGTITSAESEITQYCNDGVTKCISDEKEYNLILKDNTGLTKKCNYSKIEWKEDGTLEITLKDFNSCF
jgi:hypothetical protein